jgi:hypothetical protein
MRDRVLQGELALVMTEVLGAEPVDVETVMVSVK